MLENILWPVVSLGAMALIFGAGLAFASKKFAVEVDPKAEQIREVLPGANCGGCGYAGCDSYAAAVAAGEASATACPAGGSDVTAKIAEILGMSLEAKERNVARVMCGGPCTEENRKYQYHGIGGCKAVSMLSGGNKGCSYGCLGLGTCMNTCPFDAISISKDGIAVVDEDKCTGCGKCVAVCPKGIIQLIPAPQGVRILCSSKDKGKAVKEWCEVGCIGCQMCVKACKFDAMTFENNLPKIDYDKCTGCMVCAEKCPTKSIYADLSNRKTASIDQDLCIGCTICVKTCKFDAIEGERKQKHWVLEDKCVGCGQCIVKCPKNAITMK
ncbi:MAG: RnfABCDGE type electron transport complex subunit B [Mahellales bacterium]|jgi:electron transport complex protein RnfB